MAACKCVCSENWPDTGWQKWEELSPYTCSLVYFKSANHVKD